MPQTAKGFVALLAAQRLARWQRGESSTPAANILEIAVSLACIVVVVVMILSCWTFKVCVSVSLLLSLLVLCAVPERISMVDYQALRSSQLLLDAVTLDWPLSGK